MKKQVCIVSLCSLVWLSCTKDETTPTTDCFELNDSGCNWDNAFTQVFPSFHQPCFNPDNPAEFLYIRLENENAILLSYNTITGASKVIYKPIGNHFWMSAPDWGSDDRVVYGSDFQIFTMKEDGANHIQLTFQEGNYFPFWNWDGNRIIFGQLSSNPSYKIMMMDKNGGLLDTLPHDNLPVGNSLKYGCALPGGRIAYVVTHQPRTIKIATEIPFEQIHEISPVMESEIADLDYIPTTNSVIWCNEQGIFVTDLDTELTRQIKKDECGSIRYTHLSVSSLGDQFVVSTRVYTRVAKCQFEERNEIRQMNIDGSNEQEIPLP